MAGRNRYNSFGLLSGELSNQQHQAVREPTAGAVVDVFHTIIITLLLPKWKWLAEIVTIGYCYTIVTIAAFRGPFGCVLSPREPHPSYGHVSRSASRFRLLEHFLVARILIGRQSYDRKSLHRHTSAPHYKPRRCAYRVESPTVQRRSSAYIVRRYDSCNHP